MPSVRSSLLIASVVSIALAFLWVEWRFALDLQEATKHARVGSTIAATPCGPIEYQVAGLGPAVLIVHGSGGGHDQGMDWARPLVDHGVQVIAMSRFGYLRTPRPANASPQAQADAHICLLDFLGIARAAIIGMSAGSPSAIQAAIRHPGRIRALALIVPIAWQPENLTRARTSVPDRKDALLMRLPYFPQVDRRIWPQFGARGLSGPTDRGLCWRP